MLLITVFGVLTLIGIMLMIISNHSYKFDYGTTGCFVAFFSGLCFIGALVVTIDLKSNFAYKEDRYNNLKAQVEMCDRDDIVTGANLRNQVLEMNNDIAKHRQYSKNVWIGMYYSERLGSLEPLQWKTNK